MKEKPTHLAHLVDLRRAQTPLQPIYDRLARFDEAYFSLLDAKLRGITYMTAEILHCYCQTGAAILAK